MNIMCNLRLLLSSNLSHMQNIIRFEIVNCQSCGCMCINTVQCTHYSGYLLHETTYTLKVRLILISTADTGK